MVIINVVFFNCLWIYPEVKNEATLVLYIIGNCSAKSHFG